LEITKGIEMYWVVLLHVSVHVDVLVQLFIDNSISVDA